MFIVEHRVWGKNCSATWSTRARKTRLLLNSGRNVSSARFSCIGNLIIAKWYSVSRRTPCPERLQAWTCAGGDNGVHGSFVRFFFYAQICRSFLLHWTGMIFFSRLVIAITSHLLTFYWLVISCEEIPTGYVKEENPHYQDKWSKRHVYTRPTLLQGLCQLASTPSPNIPARHARP